MDMDALRRVGHPPPIGIGMPPQDVPTQGHAAAAAVAHGHHSPPVVAPGVTGGSGVVVAAALSSEIEARRSHRHRRPRAPATESGSDMYDAASVRSEPGFSAAVHYSESAPATASPAVIGSRRENRAAASNSAARDGVPARDFTGGFDRCDSPSVAARPNGTVTGGKHRYHQAAVGSSSGGGNGGVYYADNYAAASNSSSRLIREPAAPPPPHRRPTNKPQKDKGTPSSSAAPPPQEPSEDELVRVGLEVASKMDMATLRSMVNEHIRRNQEAEAAEESLHFWRPFTDDEVQADLRAIDDKVAARKAKAAASGSGKRSRH